MFFYKHKHITSWLHILFEGIILVMMLDKSFKWILMLIAKIIKSRVMGYKYFTGIKIMLSSCWIKQSSVIKTEIYMTEFTTLIETNKINKIKPQSFGIWKLENALLAVLTTILSFISLSRVNWRQQNGIWKETVLGPQYSLSCVNEYNSEVNVGGIRWFPNLTYKHTKVPMAYFTKQN